VTFDVTCYGVINQLRTTKQVNYRIEHSFQFPLVQEVLKFIKKYGNYGPKRSGILWTTVCNNNMYICNVARKSSTAMFH